MHKGIVKKLSHLQVIALGYLLIITCGALLLMLPAASRDGTSTSFTDALFTATSASCVTGLVIADTAVHWSLFGQIVILAMIQIGGLGFMTIATLFFFVLRRKIGLREREVMVESINTTQVGGIVRLTKKIIIATAIFEITGAVLLSIRFVPEMGVGRGIYCGIFHSVSAFCNAGFDIMGTESAPYVSFTRYAGDPLVNLTLMALIVVGGIGFLVWDDISQNTWHIRRYRLHSKLALTTTGILIAGGALLFFLLESPARAGEMQTGQQLLAASFDSVTARTAGFNTTDTAALSSGGKLLTMILMFIGGSPGSTAGGIKTVTLAVLLLHCFSGIRRRGSSVAFGRRIEEDYLKRATTILFINLSLALTGVLLICGMQPDLALTDVLFEAFSAIGTVGLSTGITREMGMLSQIVLIFLMYCGRIGSVTFAVALFERRGPAPAVTHPSEKLTVG